MSGRMTTFLGWVTLAAVLGALWVLFGEDPRRQQGARSGPLYENFEADLDALVILQLASPRGAVTLHRAETGWQVIERGSYPAESAKVSALVRGVIRSTRREPKTTRPARFPDLGLGETALKISFMGADSRAYAPALDVGIRSEGASGRSLTYVYKEGETRAWLVSELPALTADPADWIDPAVLDLDPALVTAVTYPDVHLERDDTTDFQVTALAPGETLQPAFVRSEPARRLATFVAADVERRSADTEAEPGRRIGLEMASGLVVTFALFERAERTWALISASGPDAAPINKATEGWRFQLSPDDAVLAARSRADFVIPAPPPPPPPPPPPIATIPDNR